MSVKTIEYIRREVRNAGKVLCGNSIPTHMFVIASGPTHSGASHVEILNDEYHLVVTERGKEYERQKTKEIDTLLFWIISDHVSRLAQDWELEHRVQTQDSRRFWFAKEIEYLNRLKPEWAQRRKHDQLKTLRSHPFNDGI